MYGTVSPFFRSNSSFNISRYLEYFKLFFTTALPCIYAALSIAFHIRLKLLHNFIILNTDINSFISVFYKK